MRSLTKIALVFIGSIFVALAVIGVFLPLLPTTPFLLLASACYVRSSDRLYRWLMSNRFFGSYISNIRHKRGIPLRAKVVTIALLWASLLFSIYRVEAIVLESVLIAIGIGTSTLILRMKTLEERE